MRPTFQPRLINRPFDDPGLYISFTHRKQAVLFDAGDLSVLSPGDLLKVKHIFVTHTHMDHFIGFDHLLRMLLGRGILIRLFGPPGFLDNLEGKLKGYSWNLVQGYPEALILVATEIHHGKSLSRTYRCQSGFEGSDRQNCFLSNNIIYKDDTFEVACEILDHQIPCLGYAIREQFHINILKNKLEALRLNAGPWVSKFKLLLHQGADPGTIIEVDSHANASEPNRLELGWLAERITRVTPGQKVTYITDVCYSADNEEKIISLAKGSDQLFIEAAFLEKDRNIAARKHHLTAHQAGSIARKAGVKQMSVFHYSPRYTNSGHLLEAEAQKAFRG
ncbi:MAG: ribonuclease Z [Desulfobacteraceae bacterium]|nr:ribonuclease Z [Desulfobacteraceae bacterium]